jgi:hypothetical protein
MTFQFLNRKGEPIELTSRLEAFALRYARRWEARHGSPPRGDHPFPNPWNYTFIVDFGFQAPASDDQALASRDTTAA